MPLLYVLWTVALLTVIATAISATGTVSYRLTHNAVEFARHEALAEAALNRAVLGLLDKRPGQRWRVDAVPQSFSFDGIEMRVSIQDELGHIDLNNADALLAGLFREIGRAGEETDSLVDRIIDWRDPDDLRRLHGAESAEYRSAGFPNRPRNAPFASVEELKLVLGITPEMFRRAEPYLTVYSGRATIDPRFASAELRRALSSSREAYGVIADTPPSEQPSATGVGAIDLFVPLEGRAFLIHVEFASGTSRIAREAVIRLTGNPVKPYWLLHWRQISPTAP